MLQVRTVFLILLQLNIAYVTEGGHYLDLEYYNVSMEGKSKKVKSCHAEVVTVEGHQVINAHIEFNENINEVHVNGTLDIIRGNKKYRMYDALIDFCKAMRGRSKMNLVLVVYNQFSAFGYMPHSCPMVAHVNYTITNFRINTKLLPIYTPRMNFIIDVNIYCGKELIYNIIVQGVGESKNEINITNTKIQ